MNARFPHNREPGFSPVPSSQTAGAVSTTSAVPATCPDCGSPFLYRITDEDTGCSYPVDDGEHYCRPCDALFTDEYLSRPAYPCPMMTMEQVQDRIARVFLGVPSPTPHTTRTIDHKVSNNSGDKR